MAARSRLIACRALFAFLVTLAGVPRSTAAQDLTPEQLEWMRGHAFDPPPVGGWTRRADAVRARRAALGRAGQLLGLSPGEAAVQNAALAGRVHLPVLAVIYPDVPESFTPGALDEAIFGTAGSPDVVSLSEYYAEVSNGLLTITGDVTPWIVLDSAAAYYLPGDQYGWPNRGNHWNEWTSSIMSHADSVVDFGAFDNDGLDGIPNSGDDDGEVDLLVILYATDCLGDARNGFVWPGAGYIFATTSDPSANGGYITTGPAVWASAQNGSVCTPTYSGTLAHEVGHAFGLPDLYDYDFSSQGIGSWGLMGYGLYSSVSSPAYPCAWSREQLGWITVTHPSNAVTLPPAEHAHTAFRFDPAGSTQYFLMENRQRLGSDAYIPGEGLLVWHVDPDVGSMTDERHKHVDLEEASGGQTLDANGGSDARDPFPGADGRTRFGPATIPNSDLYDGTQSGLFIEGIELEQDRTVSFLLPQLLTVGQVVPNLQGVVGSEKHFVVVVDEDVSLLWVEATMGTGNIDLEVRSIFQTISPVTRCQSQGGSGALGCLIPWPAQALWWIAIRGATDYSGVNLTVHTSHPEPVIVVSPDSIRGMLLQGDVARLDTVSLSNLGESVLTWQAAGRPGWMSMTPSEGSLAPSESQLLSIVVNASSLASGAKAIAVAFQGNAANGPDTLSVVLDVVAGLSIAELASEVLGQGQLSAAQRAFVDANGNRNNRVDVGDLAAWIDSHRSGVSGVVVKPRPGRSPPRRLGRKQP